MFYIGAMLLSVVGSGAAALASRLNPNPHERTEQLTEKLLEVLQAARAATVASISTPSNEMSTMCSRAC